MVSLVSGMVRSTLVLVIDSIWLVDASLPLRCQHANPHREAVLLGLQISGGTTYIMNKLLDRKSIGGTSRVAERLAANES